MQLFTTKGLTATERALVKAEQTNRLNHLTKQLKDLTKRYKSLIIFKDGEYRYLTESIQDCKELISKL